MTPTQEQSVILEICQQIERTIGRDSQLFYPGDLQYSDDLVSFSAANQDQPVCVVEPGTVQDVSAILKIPGSKRVPFGVRSGGQMANPHSSSTTGVLIALRRFNGITYDEQTNSVIVGTGARWPDVYDALDPHGVTAVGGRVIGPAVGWFLLGGGYSYLSNQYGLGFDNIIEMEVVLPDGEIITVTEESNPDLYFALRGTWNNFGIVTKFKLKAYPIRQVYGGMALYDGEAAIAVRNATLKYLSDVTDAKSSLIVCYNAIGSQTIISVLMFYDAPTPPQGIFDDFLAIPGLPGAPADVKTRSYLALIKAAGAAPDGQRQLYVGTPFLGYSSAMIDKIIDQTQKYISEGGQHGQTSATIAIEPFLPTINDNARRAAIPRTPDLPLSPFQNARSCNSSSEDAYFLQSSLEFNRELTELAIAEGQAALRDDPNAVRYGNYAPPNTTPEQLWGTNLPRLQVLKKRYDPENIMGLAGGFKIPM